MLPTMAFPASSIAGDDAIGPPVRYAQRTTPELVSAMTSPSAVATHVRPSALNAGELSPAASGTLCAICAFVGPGSADQPARVEQPPRSGQGASGWRPAPIPQTSPGGGSGSGVGGAVSPMNGASNAASFRWALGRSSSPPHDAKATMPIAASALQERMTTKRCMCAHMLVRFLPARRSTRSFSSRARSRAGSRCSARHRSAYTERGRRVAHEASRSRPGSSRRSARARAWDLHMQRTRARRHGARRSTRSTRRSDAPASRQTRAPRASGAPRRASLRSDRPRDAPFSTASRRPSSSTSPPP